MSTTPQDLLSLLFSQKSSFSPAEAHQLATDLSFADDDRQKQPEAALHAETNASDETPPAKTESDADEFLRSCADWRSLADAVPGGIGIFDVATDGTFTLRYLNRGFHRLVQDSAANREKYTGCRFWDAIHPEDLAHVRSITQAICHGASSIDLQYRVRNGQGGFTWLRVMGNVSREADGKAHVYCSFSNVDKTMTALLELRNSQALLQVALKTARMSSWEYDVLHRCICQTELSQQQHGYGMTISNVPESLIADGYVHPGSVETFRRLFEPVEKGAAPRQGDVLIRTQGEGNYWWEHLVLIPLFDAEGRNIRLLGTSMDVSETKKLQDKYRQQLQDMENLNSVDLIAKARYNLSRNTVEYYYSKADSGICPEAVYDYDSGLASTAARLVDPNKKAVLLRLFDRHRLLGPDRPADGTVSLEYQRRTQGGDVFWCLSKATLSQNPVTDETVCFLYSYDITEQKNLQGMIDTVVRCDYDCLVLIDCRSNSHVVYAQNAEQRERLPAKSADYEKCILDYARAWVIPEDFERYRHDTSLANIRLALKTQERFSSYVTLYGENGVQQRKLLQFSYLDRMQEKVLLTQTDVSAIYERDQCKLAELLAAKDAAEKARQEAEEAYSIKTQFLSRMSHDLRTPLNAVIGLSDLAADELGDPAAMEHYIHSIHTAGHFLLSLVNDCLDFEKLAADKLKLTPEPYSYTRFSENLHILLDPLCQAKKITLVLDAPVEENILTDPLRFEQIFVNLLTNAVKFTPEGGRVELCIPQKERRGDRLFLTIVVRDNGIGMSEDFKRRLFQPFEQEGDETLPQKQGTGLGLSIVKNLVEKMGGRIDVKSEKGVGSEFTVHMDFAMAPAAPAPPPACPARTDLRGRRVLLVEDQPVNTEIAKKLLERQGIVVTCAKNGRQALELFTVSSPDTYEVILMDIHMPVMDGLTAARAIRALDRADAALIPILAMSANAFEADVQISLRAGMNAHLSKPIQPSILYAALTKALYGTGKKPPN